MSSKKLQWQELTPSIENKLTLSNSVIVLDLEKEMEEVRNTYLSFEGCQSMEAKSDKRPNFRLE
jgi:hypothetical protein